MSKEAAQRAMREARYQERAAALAKPGGAANGTTPDAVVEGLCAHRSMNGRTCTREAGHAAKSHRYS